MATPVRLLEHDDFDGSMNMALDEVLWHSAAEDGPYLRFYGWSDRPAISLGYFQSCREVLDRSNWRGLPFVRRVTGGGALVHDHDLTFALALPTRLAPPTRPLYERVHRAFATALRQMGVACELGAHTEHETTPETLCFRRNDRFALSVKGTKVLGSAQRRDSASVLIHGSLLLAASAAASELVGLRELVGQDTDSEQLRTAVADAMAVELDLRIQEVSATDGLFGAARRLVELKYGSHEWNQLK
jgi:lipoate-protein ligase A